MTGKEVIKKYITYLAEGGWQEILGSIISHFFVFVENVIHPQPTTPEASKPGSLRSLDQQTLSLLDEAFVTRQNTSIPRYDFLELPEPYLGLIYNYMYAQAPYFTKYARQPVYLIDEVAILFFSCQWCGTEEYPVVSEITGDIICPKCGGWLR